MIIIIIIMRQLFNQIQLNAKLLQELVVDLVDLKPFRCRGMTTSLRD